MVGDGAGGAATQQVGHLHTAGRPQRSQGVERGQFFALARDRGHGRTLRHGPLVPHTVHVPD